MKLTKGRINKVLKCKKQTMKNRQRHAESRESGKPKNCTFRNKKPLNLRIKTLKNLSI
jgi:hypothetical protein